MRRGGPNSTGLAVTPEDELVTTANAPAPMANDATPTDWRAEIAAGTARLTAFLAELKGAGVV